MPDVRRGAALIEGVKLVVRCREANVEPCMTGPDVERLDERFDN